MLSKKLSPKYQSFPGFCLLSMAQQHEFKADGRRNIGHISIPSNAEIVLLRLVFDRFCTPVLHIGLLTTNRTPKRFAKPTEKTKPRDGLV